MTLREYMAENRPDQIADSEWCDGGVHGCPNSYDELDGHYKQLFDCSRDDSCDKCWGQEYINDMPTDEKSDVCNCKCVTRCGNCNRHLLGNNDVYDNKRDFVLNELTALVQRIDPDIERLEYNVDLRGEEIVTIYRGNHALNARVTADSLAGIVTDVLRRLS